MKAAASSLAEIHRAAFDPKGFAEDQRLGRLSAGGFENPAERRAGNRHPFRRLLLVKALVIRQAESLELVEGHDDLFELGEMSPGRFENPGRRAAGDVAAAIGSGHGRFFSILL